MFVDISSAAPGITATVGVAAIKCAASTFEPIFATSVAASAMSSGATITADIATSRSSSTYRHDEIIARTAMPN
jgi:hypothetical protein